MTYSRKGSRRTFLTSLTGLGLAVTAACTLQLPPDAAPYVPKYTYQQALDLNEQHARDAAASLHPRPQRLEELPRITGEVPCDGPHDDQPTGDVMLEHAYWLRGLDPANNSRVFDQIESWWAANGYHIELVEKQNPNDGSRTTGARGPDDFKMTLVQQGGTGALSISTQSPCVHPIPHPATTTTTT